MVRGQLMYVASLLGCKHSSILLRYLIVISSLLVLILLHPLFHDSFFTSTFMCQNVGIRMSIINTCLK